MGWPWPRTSGVAAGLPCGIEAKPEGACYLCYAPGGKHIVETLVRVAGRLWLIEQSFEAANGVYGLHQDKARITPTVLSRY